MRTFIADIIPRIQQFSKKLDDLTSLTGQHWVSLGEIEQKKTVYIFRPNNQLLISENGIVKKSSWEYLGNQSLLIESGNSSLLLKHGFLDENILALKLDSEYRYVIFINETKYGNEINNLEDVNNFLEKKYKNRNINSGVSYNNLGYASEQFYVLSEMNEFGPYSRNEISKLLNDGEVTRMNFVREANEIGYSRQKRVKDFL